MPASHLRFLVVEDHDFQRLSVVQLLKTLGAAAVHGAEDGQAALRVLRDPDRPVDIVISDLSMPGMDGMEFIRHLGEAKAAVSLIIASALDAPLLASIANMASAYRVKLLGAIAKPVAASKLTPLLELHRSWTAHPDAPGIAFSFEEIAHAWTYNEFELWFEPQVNLITGAVRGMHVGWNWRHPSLGLLSPDAFMPSIVARGLKDDFNWRMLQKSVAQCRQWQDEGTSLVVSANLGFDSLTDVNMATRVKQLAEAEHLDPKSMVLGVAEEALNAELPRALENLARLRVQGFGLAIDNFGSGPMAVEQLALVAFTELKIKSLFVAGASTDPAVRAGLAVSLEVAQQLRLQTIASGIESEREWHLVRDWGCHLGQGPFIAAPMSQDAVIPWVCGWQARAVR